MCTVAGDFPLESRVCLASHRNDSGGVDGQMPNGLKALSSVIRLTQVLASDVAQATSDRDGILKRLRQPRTGCFFLQARLEGSSASSQWL